MKKRILVVDDEWAILELLKFRFSKRGFEVVTAKNEEEFLERALSQRPDLIILDIWLGNRIGTEIYSRLLGDGFDPQVPVIFVTALIEGEPPTRALAGRRYALYGKPFDFEELVEEVLTLTGTRNMEGRRCRNEKSDSSDRSGGGRKPFRF